MSFIRCRVGLGSLARRVSHLFSWLLEELNKKMPFNVSGENEQSSNLAFLHCSPRLLDVLNVYILTKKDFDEVMEEVYMDELKLDHLMETDTETNAESLKDEVLNLDSASKAVELANGILELCIASRQNSLAILDLIQPWKVDDEFAAVLISHLSEVNYGDES